MSDSFHSFYDYYISTCNENSDLNCRPMLDPFDSKRGNFNYSSIKERLERLRSTIPRDASSDDDDDDEEEEGARETHSQSDASSDVPSAAGTSSQNKQQSQ